MKNIKAISNLRRHILVAGLYLLGPVFLLNTDPQKLPLPLLVLPFVWLFSVIFISTLLVLSKRPSVTKKQRVMVAGIVASIPVLLIIFQSIHQLSLKDVLLSVSLVLLAAFYMLRADFIR